MLKKRPVRRNYLYISCIVFTFAPSFLDQVMHGNSFLLLGVTEKVVNGKKTIALLQYGFVVGVVFKVVFV